MKYKIGIDIDDCISKSVEHFCEKAKKLYGKNITPELLTAETGRFEDSGVLTSEEVFGIIKRDRQWRTFRKLKVHDGAVESINTLKSVGHKIFFVTSRDNYELKLVKKDTEYWLDKIGIRGYDGLFFTEEKGTLVSDKNLHFFIEDRIRYCSQVLEAGSKVFLIHRPWNVHFERKGVIRIFSWKNILSYM